MIGHVGNYKKNTFFYSFGLLRFVIYIASSLAMVACGSVPHPDLKVAAPVVWRNKPEITSLPVASNELWWRSLNDQALNETIDLAIKNNLTVAQSYERLNAERALEKATIASHKPRVALYLGPNSSVAFSNYRSSSAFLFGFDFNWEIPYTAKKEGELIMAKADAYKAFIGMISARASLVAEVVRVYGELRAADQKIRSLRKIAAYQSGIVEMFERSESLGAASLEDLSAVRQKQVEVDAALSEMLVARESAIQRLDVLCGLDAPLERWSDLADISWSLERAQITPIAVPADLIMERPDVQLSISNVMHAAGAVGVSESELYPKIGLEGAVLYSGTITEKQGVNTPEGLIKFLAPSLRLPIVDWGMRRDQLNASEAELRGAILSYRDTVLHAIAETEIAIANFNAMNSRLIQAENEVRKLEASAKRQQQGLHAGYLSPLEAFRAFAKMQELKLAHADNQSLWLSAFAVVNKAQTNMAFEKARNAEELPEALIR